MINEKHLWITSTIDNHWTLGSRLMTGANKYSGFKRFDIYQPSTLPGIIMLHQSIGIVEIAEAATT